MPASSSPSDSVVEVTLAQVVSAGPQLMARFASAAQILEKAVGSGSNPDPNVVYMLFLAYKRQGKITEARNTLRKIQKPDANVFLQMGLLSLEEGQLAQAEGEFSRGWSMDPSSYEICYNLLLTQLTLGKIDPCLELIPKAVALVDQQARPNA